MEGTDFTSTGMHCLRFYYCMNGYHSGELRVYTRQSGENNRKKWSMSDDQKNGWRKAAVEINMDRVVEVGWREYIVFFREGKLKLLLY